VSDAAIRIESLTRDFGKVRALEDLSLEVERGSVFGFLGPNGAGKTTTIRLLLGLLEPTKGKAEVLGFDTRREANDIRCRAGALLEHTGLYERLSAEDNLDYYGQIQRMPHAERRARIKELLSSVDLWERRKEPVKKWSRGMKQKVAVARALLHRPEIVFLDEPTAGFDPSSAAALRDDLAKLASREGVTVFLCTHNLFEAERLCDRVGVVRQGKLVAVGSPDELRAGSGGERTEIIGQGFGEKVLGMLRERAEVRSAEIGNGRAVIELEEKAKMAPLVSLMVREGVEIEEVRRGKASLEEVFLKLMEEEEG
jgi:ABC-2 type transport system ATP-binding protein